MNTIFNRKRFTSIIFCILLIGCKTQSPSSSSAPTDEKITEVTTSYNKDIAPMMQNSCSPCHFPGGQKKMLDSYSSVKSEASEILERVVLPQDDVKFMPFKIKKTPLTSSEITTLKKWIAEGMPE